MSKIKNEDLRFLIKDFLFENQINEKYQPDPAHYVSYNMSHYIAYRISY